MLLRSQPDYSVWALIFTTVWPTVAGLLFWLSRRKAERKKAKLDEVAARTDEFERLLTIYREEADTLRRRVDWQQTWIEQLEETLRANNLRLPVMQPRWRDP